MRSLLLVAGLASACAPRFAPVASNIAAPVTVGRLTGRWSNIYLLRKGDVAIAIDSGSPVDCERVAAALGSEPKLRAVIVTHAHADHAGCARALQQRGAAIVLGAGDIPIAARGSNPRLQPTGLLAAMLAPLFMFAYEPFTPDLAVDHEVDLRAYGFPEVHVAPAPGHTPGEVVIYLGDAAFVGDMLKGGEVLAHSPTEHLYQTDCAGDHAVVATTLARPDVAELFPGHGGRLDAGDVRGWLADADTSGMAGALSFELDGRGQSNGGTGGMRGRFAIGGTLGYAVGADVRAGYLDRGVVDVDAYPIGIALRGQGGGVIMATAGAGFGGVRGVGATHAIGEVAAELPVGAARLMARASLGWRLGGAPYASEVGGIADELDALLGVRLGGDAPWADYLAGHGIFLAATLADLGGDRRIGVALGVSVDSAH